MLHTTIASLLTFPISRDPPEGGTIDANNLDVKSKSSFQFLGIPPKGELGQKRKASLLAKCFQFLGIPPKGEQISLAFSYELGILRFPISRDPPEGGTLVSAEEY